MEQAQALPTFKVKSHVTLPLLKVEDEKEYVVTITTKFVKGEAAPARKIKEEVTDPETGEVKTVETMSKPVEPPTLCQVVNLLDGKPYQMIAGAVLHSEIVKKYPDESYLGKSFQFNVYRIAGKRYKGVQIAEVELETPAADAVAETPAKSTKSK